MANTRKTGSAARATTRLSERNKADLAAYMEIMGVDASTVLRAGLEALTSLYNLDGETAGAFVQGAFEAVERDNKKGVRE